MKKPVIGITRKSGTPVKSHGAYRDRISEAGGEPVDLFHGKDSANHFIRRAGIQGMLFTGGGDLNPRLYGEQNQASRNIDDNRDSFELELMREALAADLPILAVCRGFQLLNVACGGKLLQDLESNRAYHAAHNEVSAHHEVDIVEGSRLRGVLKKDRIRVNSRHHQAVNTEIIGHSLAVAAIATGQNIVEALELPKARWVIAVQWHPERTGDEIAETFQSLFAEFVRVAAPGETEPRK